MILTILLPESLKLLASIDIFIFLNTNINKKKVIESIGWDSRKKYKKSTFQKIIQSLSFLVKDAAHKKTNLIPIPIQT